MTPEEALAGGLKLLFALAVLRWPLPGACLSILADGLDVVVMNYVDLGGGGIRDYHAFDKATDLFGYATFLLVALRWQGRDRSIAVGLAALRLSGIAVFELTGSRSALLFCPNLFESWFLYVLLRDAWSLRGAASAWLLGGLVGTKLVQEVLVHGVQVLDRYNLDDVLRKVLGT